MSTNKVLIAPYRDRCPTHNSAIMYSVADYCSNVSRRPTQSHMFKSVSRSNSAAEGGDSPPACLSLSSAPCACPP
jgi:hypothetical protein